MPGHVTYTDNAICLEITDDGGGEPVVSAAPGTGHGIIGMRERASL
jgi:signal transduction histidine kinase